MELKEEKKKNSAEVNVKVQLDPEELKPYLQDIYKKKAANLRIPGFRKGKAPVSLVEKRLGDSVLPDAIELAIDATLKSTWSEFKNPPVTEPECRIENFDKDKGLEFTIIYDTTPEVKIGKYKKAMTTMPELKISDEDINKELTNLQEQFAEYKEVEDEAAAVDYGMKVVLSTINYETEEEKEKQEPSDVTFFTRAGENSNEQNLNHPLRKKIESEIWGKKKGDHLTFDFTYPDDAEEENLRGKKLNFEITVGAIEKKTVPPLDDELAKKLGQFETFADFKKDLEKKMDEHAGQKVRQKALDEIIDKIIETSTFILPERLVNKDVESRAHNLGHHFGLGHKSLGEMAALIGKSEEDFRKELSDVSQRQFKKQLIISEIFTKEDMQLSDEDRTAWFAKEADRTGQKPEDISAQVEKEDKLWELEAEIKNNKVIDFLIEKNTKKKGTVTYAELMETNNQGGQAAG